MLSYGYGSHLNGFRFRAGVQPDVSHAHAQRQEAVHVPRLRQRVLPELRPEETSAETPRRRLPTAAGRDAPARARRTAAAARNPRSGVVRVRVPDDRGTCDRTPSRRAAADLVPLLSCAV